MAKFRENLDNRDGACLFCWGTKELEACHIIARKSILISTDVSSTLKRCGLERKNQIQNGFRLCMVCHGEFNELKRYVDVVDDRLVLKVVNESDDPKSDKFKDWECVVGSLAANRDIWKRLWTDGRQAVEANGEMALYFKQNDPKNLPNRKALEFHKTACLIWRMAGGAEEDDDYSEDDYDDVVDVFVNYQGKDDIIKWIDSTAIELTS